MALIVCPLCVREDDIFLIRVLPDGRKEARCDDCDFVFTYGKAVEEPPPAAAKPRPKAKPKAAAARTRVPAKASVPSIQIALKQFQTSVELLGRGCRASVRAQAGVPARGVCSQAGGAASLAEVRLGLLAGRARQGSDLRPRAVRP
ncbi:hypothetical protein [Aeromicrobium sp. UC242_57]|uniref:hypothetical protein n=1 Tax=Aeromicrobium sp. UC242_57 TaxID=3374624 RepID=UPI0037B7B597